MSVQLGFVSETREEFKLVYPIHDLPNKVGGLPVWLNPSIIMDFDCEKCGFPMQLLLQVYTPEDEFIDAFHRIIFVFCCKTDKTFKILRSQLPQVNSVYDLDGNLLLEYSNPCPVCNQFGMKKCGNCEQRYCSKKHQALDWNLHKAECKDNVLVDRKYTTFPEYELLSDVEPAKQDWIDKENEKYQALIDNSTNNQEIENEAETQVDVDKQFLKFEKRIALEPDQVFRYCRTQDEPEPLYVCEKGKPSTIPSCECGSPRTFEFQIMPQLLHYLNLDPKDPYALDWGTLLIYTCNANCKPRNGYAEEYLFLQKFSTAGMQDSVWKS